ncbi:MAG: DUF58 domain-containing protein, partial [Bifidobacteriaceae bacterium]|nr:DUF58 domain-containing protein [Bifidobacteriaceae bacterium]
MGAGLGALVAGWMAGWPELAAPGGAITAVFVVGSATAIGRVRLSAELAARHRRVGVGGDPGLTATVKNLGVRRSGPRRATLPVGGSGVGLVLPALAPGSSATAAITIPTGRRGVLRVGPLQAVRGDPFGMVARTWSWGEPLEVVVYPKTIPVPVGASGMAKDIEGKPTGQASEADISFHSLREYVAGEDRRAIHWRSTARTGRLMVRQSEDTRRVQMALLVATAAGEYAQAADFELAVSAYASVGLAQLATSGELAVIAQGAVLPLAKSGPGALLDHAAAINLAEAP